VSGSPFANRTLAPAKTKAAINGGRGRGDAPEVALRPAPHFDTPNALAKVIAGNIRREVRAQWVDAQSGTGKCTSMEHEHMSTQHKLQIVRFMVFLTAWSLAMGDNVPLFAEGVGLGVIITSVVDLMTVHHLL
jgi:hypothetical protein